VASRTFLLLTCLISAIALVAHAQSSNCTNYYQPSIATPTGYGAAYNLFDTGSRISGKRRLFKWCAGRDRRLEQIFAICLRSRLSVCEWRLAKHLACIAQYDQRLECVVQAYATAQLPIATPTTWTYVVGYVCIWNPPTGPGTQAAGAGGSGTWLCGCRDTTCATNYWQLQAVENEAQIGGGTSNGVLPAKIVGEWWWPFSGGMTLTTMMQQAPEVNYASLAGALTDANEDGNVTDYIPGSGVYSSESQLASDVAAWKASGRVVLGVVGGDGSQPNANIKNETDVSEFMAAAVPIIDRLGYQGVDFDLESNPDPASLADLIKQLKAHYGPNFIISLDPRPFELRSGGVYRAVIEDAGIDNIDLVQPQDYALNGDSLAGQQTYMNGDMDDWINDKSGLSIPANKIVIGTGSVDNGGESVSTAVQTYQYYKSVYPTLRGAIEWASVSDSNAGWQFAQGIAASP
jgi:chitinase